MPIGTGGTLGVLLMLGIALGATPVAAQTSAGGTWTDPPARGATPADAVAPPGSASAGPTEKAGRIGSGESKSGMIAERRPSVAPVPVPRRTALRDIKPIREARHARARSVADAAPARIVRPRAAIRREAIRPPRRIAARSFAPYASGAQPYTFDPRPMPVGRAEGPPYGERNPIFADDYGRMRRIAAAQAAGYLVVRGRSVHFPDGRTLHTYRPYEGEDDLD